MIEISNLHKSFGPKKVLSGVSFKISPGKTLCVIGKSGCGKSVLLKHIVGLLEADQGYVKVDGKDVGSMKKNELFGIRRKMGFVFQGSALFDSYDVFENVVIGLYEHGEKDKTVLENEAKRVLAAVGLLPDIDVCSPEEFNDEWEILSKKKPSDLSGGMRKRVGVARALVGSPDYIFYDEPTTGLDPVTSDRIDALIANLADKLNVTSIVITHDLFSVDKLAENVVMLDGGKVRFEGSPSELKESKDEAVLEFLKRYS